jgi:hypothetical protein
MMNRKLLGYSPDLDVFDDAIAARRGASNRVRIDREIVALETACAEQAAELLDAPRGPRLQAWLAQHLRCAARASSRTIERGTEAELIRLLERAARIALPPSSPAAPAATAQAARFFGMELEGLSPEDKEFEVARRFAQLVTEAARHAVSAPATLPPVAAAWRAFAQAARRHAPGWPHASPPPRSTAITAGGSRLLPLQGAHHA